MARPDTSDDEMTALYNALIPALSRAAVGDFDSELEIDPSNPRRVNEILMGVEVLLEVLREKHGTSGVQTHPARRPRTVKLLDEMLDQRSADR